MSYRGPALQYKIRKTTVNNKTGDSFAITLPRILAQQFGDIYFSVTVSGNSLTFTSGCKLKVSNISEREIKKVFTEGGTVIFE